MLAVLKSICLGDLTFKSTPMRWFERFFLARRVMSADTDAAGNHNCFSRFVCLAAAPSTLCEATLGEEMFESVSRSEHKGFQLVSLTFHTLQSDH